jgi:hypothetical protein
MHNDIWSLGIILLNLATGRNPWKSATADDPTFQAYLRGPNTFLPSVLPISSEVNKILVGMLDINYRRRTPLREVRRAIRDVTSFYSEGVIFEGSMARCPWESGMDIDSDSSEESEPLPRSPEPEPEVAVSRWSKDTTSDIVFAHPDKQLCIEGSTFDCTNRSSCGATWAYESTISSTSSSESEPGLDNSDMFDGSRTPSETSIQSPTSSFPATPNSAEIAFGSKAAMPNRKALTINTNIPRPRFCDHIASINNNSFSEESAIMQTAIEYDPYSSMFYLTSAISESKVIALPASAVTTTAVAEDKEMTSPSAWQASQDISSPSIYSRSSSRTSSSPSIMSPRSILPRHFRTGLLSPSVFLRSNSPSPEPNWLPLRVQPRQVPSVTDNYFSEQSQHLSPVYNTIAMTDALSSSSPPSPSRQPPASFPQPPTPIPASDQHDKPQLIEGGGASNAGTSGTKSKLNGLFGLKFFPRTPSPGRLQIRAAHEHTRSPTAKITPIDDTIPNSPVGGTENATQSSSGFTFGGFTFEPPRQAPSSPRPEANKKTSRPLITRNKKLAQTIDAEETEGEGSGPGRRETKHRRESIWFGTREAGRRLRDRETESYASQDVSFGTPTNLSVTDGVAQKVPHQENSTSSPSSGRQSRFSVGRRNRREQRSRSPRHWFMPGRLFASAGAAS